MMLPYEMHLMTILRTAMISSQAQEEKNTLLLFKKRMLIHYLITTCI